ncbi:MAG: hypothetical protein R3344_13720, partial [Acidobacteriota bacterium]|nr:hypothetical protein [Acidobacteriota bacterium]
TPGGSVGGPPSLARIANESGGRGTWGINDMTLAYARVQRDLACRYALGFYAEPAKRGTRSIRVRLNHQGTTLRFPEMIKQWTDEERRESRLRAAFADPERFDEPLIRATVIPARARSASKWEAVAVVHFPLPLEDGDARVNVSATLSRGHLSLDKFQRKLELDASRANDAGDLPVTLVGSADLRPGSYNLAVALDRPGDSAVHTTSTSFVLPEIPETGLFVRGPILAKATEHGVLLRGGDKPDESDAELRRLMGDNASLEPLIVHRIDAGETLLAFWEACTIDKAMVAEGAMVYQKFVSGGDVVYEADPIPLELVGKKKGARCHGHGEKVPPGTLAPGRYRLMLSIDDASGESIAAGLVPFMVRDMPLSQEKGQTSSEAR